MNQVVVTNMTRECGGLMASERETMTQPDKALPLAGIRVIDLTRVMTGPYCTMMLGDLGADVIKIELPGKGDDTRAWGPPFVNGESSYFLSVNRNKRSLALNLKDPGAQDLLWRLIEGADVVAENFTPGTVDRLGFGYEAVRARKPDIIYASISGFGQTGPSHLRTAYDLILQGMSGMMSVTGPEGGQPTKHGLPIADLAAGMFTAHAILAALFARERTGEGQYVDVSLLSGQVALLTYQAAIYFTTGRAPQPLGNRHPIITPYDTFRTADGYVNIAVGNDSLWQRFCQALELPELADDPRFRTNADRAAHRPEVYAAIEPPLAALPTAEVVARLDAKGVPCGPIADLAQVFTDPQTLDQELLQEVEHPTAGSLSLTGFPYHFHGTPLTIRRPPPRLGEHTRELMTEAGLSAAEQADLIARGAVATGE